MSDDLGLDLNHLTLSTTSHNLKSHLSPKSPKSPDLSNLPSDWNEWNIEYIETKDTDNTEINEYIAYSSKILNIEFKVVVKQIKGIGFQLWPASIVMLRWMETEMNNIYGDNFIKEKNIIELGAGCGLLGMLAYYQNAKYVAVTDLIDVVPHIKLNLSANNLENNENINELPCTWGDESSWDPTLTEGYFDVILLSDCLYHEHLYEPLFSTLSKLIGPNTIVLMCQKHRWLHSEKKFFKRLNKKYTVRTVGELKYEPDQRRFEHIYEIKLKK